MSLVLDQILKNAAEKIISDYCLTAYNETVTPQKTIEKRRTSKMSWMDFSDCELRIVNEVEKKPGMKQAQIVTLMSTFDAAYPDGTCEGSTTKVLLANLVKRKVLISSGSHDGYTLNNSDTPPPPILSPA